MLRSSLAKLDDRIVAVELSVNGRQVALKGTAHYEKNSSLGAVLRVQVSDPDGDFEIVLHEEHWKGQVVKSTEAGVDFRIQLGAADLKTQPS